MSDSSYDNVAQNCIDISDPVIKLSYYDLHSDGDLASYSDEIKLLGSLLLGSGTWKFIPECSSHISGCSIQKFLYSMVELWWWLHWCRTMNELVCSIGRNSAEIIKAVGQEFDFHLCILVWNPSTSYGIVLLRKGYPIGRLLFFSCLSRELFQAQDQSSVKHPRSSLRLMMLHKLL